jgi:hypothetical protein
MPSGGQPSWPPAAQDGTAVGGQGKLPVRTPADEQAAALAARAAAQAPLDDPVAVAELLGTMRSVDAAEGQVSILIDRLPAEGLFDLFCKQASHQVLYRFGREPDGTPAPSWGWDDLN